MISLASPEVVCRDTESSALLRHLSSGEASTLTSLGGVVTGDDYTSGASARCVKNRYYDPRLGRFISRDPKGVWGDAGQLGNGQSAFGNNPFNLVDPLGFWEAPSWADIAATPQNYWERLKRLPGKVAEAGRYVKDLISEAVGGTVGDPNVRDAVKGVVEEAAKESLPLSDSAGSADAEVTATDDVGESAAKYAGAMGKDRAKVADEALAKAQEAIKSGGTSAAVPFVCGALGKTGKIISKKWPKHHPWPWYLRGWADQTLKKIPPNLHAQFHNSLDKWMGGKYRRRLTAAFYHKHLDLCEVVSDLARFYETADNGAYKHLLPDFEQAVNETLEHLAKNGGW